MATLLSCGGPSFEAQEQHISRVWGWHRALKMWSRLNRGSPECPGLVFALLPGGSCQGVAYRVGRDQADEVLVRLWEREMPMDVYTPSWLPCNTPQGPVKALAFTLPRSSPSFTGQLPCRDLPANFSASLRVLWHHPRLCPSNL